MEWEFETAADARPCFGLDVESFSEYWDDSLSDAANIEAIEWWLGRPLVEQPLEADQFQAEDRPS